MDTASDAAPAATRVSGADKLSERRARVRELLPILGSCRKVARELGVSDETVRRDAIVLGLDRSVAACSPENRLESANRARQAKELYERGDNMLEVSAALGVSERQVQRYLHRLGVAIRPSGMPPKYPAVEKRVCPVCGLQFTPRKPAYVAYGKYECCRNACGQRLRFRRGRAFGSALGEIVDQWFGPAARRKWKLVWSPNPGRPRNDARPDYEEKLASIRAMYEETHASERDLERLTGESRRMVRTALGRPL